MVRGDVNGNRSWACQDRRAWRWRFGGVRRKWGTVEGGGGGWEKGEEGGGGGRGRRGHRLERKGKRVGDDPPSGEGSGWRWRREERRRRRTVCVKVNG